MNQVNISFLDIRISCSVLEYWAFNAFWSSFIYSRSHQSPGPFKQTPDMRHTLRMWSLYICRTCFESTDFFVSLSCPFVCDRGWLLAELDEIEYGWGLYVVMRFGQGLCGKKLTFAKLCFNEMIQFCFWDVRFWWSSYSE